MICRSQHFSRQNKLPTHVGIEDIVDVDLVHGRVESGVAAEMAADDKLSEHLVLDGVGLVADNAEDIETRQDRLGELDVLLERDCRVVSSTNRVRGGDDGAAGLQGSDDTRFGDGDGLLLHRLVDRSTIRVVHLVKLVDEAVAFIGKHERAALERPFLSHRVLAH